MKKLIVILIALLCATACSKKQNFEESPSAAQKKIAHIDPATAASISGVINFSGTPPKPQKIDMSQDPACGTQPRFDESVVVDQGKLANVLVYVKNGFPNDVSFPAPSQPVVIQQKTCRYEPHVAAAMVGQVVRFENDDQTTHNVHMMPTEFKQWNESQMPSAAPIDKRFDRPEIMIPTKCNQHPWMHMYLSVLDNPFFAVTGPDGRFQITGLPPGTYTLAAIHEKLGEQDVQVTVGPKESKDVALSFVSK